MVFAEGLFFFFWPFPKVSCRLTYGCNPACPRLPLWQYRVWVGSNCHCGSAAFISPSETQRAAACPVSHVSMTFTKDCCVPPLLRLLSRCQVSVWVGGYTQTDGEVKTSAHKTETRRRGGGGGGGGGGRRRKQQTKGKCRQILLEHGCRAGRMRKHAKEGSRYKTDSRICRQTEESFRQSDKSFGQECRQAVENSGVLPGRGVRCAAPLCSALPCCVVLLHR